MLANDLFCVFFTLKMNANIPEVCRELILMFIPEEAQVLAGEPSQNSRHTDVPSGEMETQD